MFSSISNTLISQDCTFASIRATLDVIQVLYIQKSIRFDIFVYAETSPKINCIIDGILKLTEKEFITKVNHVRDLSGWQHQFNDSAVIFTRRGTNFYQLYEESLLSDDADHYLLRKHEWFSDDRCNEIENFYNVYNASSLEWLEKLEAPEKFRNFHGCMIVNEVSFYNPNYYIGIDGKSTGTMVDIFRILEKIGNFTAYQQLAEVDVGKYPKSMKYFPRNGKGLIPMIRVYEEPFYPKSLQKVHFTSVYDDLNYFFIITPGEPYNNYEKMILPFDAETWTYLLLTFALTFLIIFIISFMPKKVQNLVFGEGVWTPTLNVIYIFFGLGQMKLPLKWFPRFILLMFIIFCLIFRTCYQSLLFEFMTTDMRKSSPKTIMDLKEKNFTLLLMPFKTMEVFNNTIRGKDYQPNYKILKLEKSYEKFKEKYFFYWNQMSNHSAKLAFMLSSDQPIYRNSLPNKKLDETLMTTFRAFGTGKNSFFFPLMNEVFGQLIQSGIPTHLKRFHKWVFNKRLDPPEEAGPQVLTMDDLMFGFVIWLTTVGIAFLSFLIEFALWPRENRMRKKKKIHKIKNAKVAPIDFDIKMPYEKFLHVKTEEEINDCFKVKKKIARC